MIPIAILYILVLLLTILNFAHPVISQMPGAVNLNLWQFGLLIAFLVLTPIWVFIKFVWRIRGGHQVVTPTDPYFVLLRPFELDATIFSESIGFINRCLTVGPLRAGRTFEVEIKFAFKGVGRIVAIGCPADSIVPDGATRYYLDNESWQSKVIELIKSAKGVIMFAGTTEGVDWEMKRIREMMDPRRVLLILPAAPPASRGRMVAFAERAFHTSIQLPSQYSVIYNGPLFYVFDEDWRSEWLHRVDKRSGLNVFGIELISHLIDYKRTLSPFMSQFSGDM